MSRSLLVDVGSTFTKLTAVDGPEVIASAQRPTTVRTDVTEGYLEALSELFRRAGGKLSFDRRIACSSAAGGLRMCAVGLVEELTAEAARRVCLGAGAKVELSFAGHLTNGDLEDIRNGHIDIIILSGGTDGGNTECVLHNQRKLADARLGIPVIYAAARDCRDEIVRIRDEAGMEEYLCDNVMSRLNVLNLESAQKKTREIFLKKIIEAKGIKRIEEEIDEVLCPTPEAVLRAAELLSRGYGGENGLGDLLVLDVGGATTDVYSMCPASSGRADVILRGLEEPFARRTVEGDLGMRHSAAGAAESLSGEELRAIDEEEGMDFRAESALRAENAGFLPSDERGRRADAVTGRICVDRAVSRHAGRLEEVYTPAGLFWYQYGKDLSRVKHVVGTGGVLAKSPYAREIMEAAAASPRRPSELRPVSPEYLSDADYVMAAAGLLSAFDPLSALRIMKKHLAPAGKRQA